MKNLHLIILLAFTLFSSCKVEKSDIKKTSKVNFKQEELIGNWKRTSNNGSKKIIINNLILKKNNTADINFTDSEGTRIVTGKWSTNKSKRIMNFEFSADLALSFMQNKQSKNISFMTVAKKGDNLILKSNKSIFNKE